MSSVNARDTEIYMRHLQDAGYEVRRTRRNHWVICWGGQRVAVASCTPGRRNRSLENLKARIRRFEREQQQCQ